MTILSTAQSAIAYLTGQRIAAVVSSQDEIAVEIEAVAEEAARDIAKAHDWTALTQLAQIMGDSTETSFPLPDDYDRMNMAAGVHSSQWVSWRYTHVETLDEWLDVQQFGLVTPGYWTQLGGRFQILPAPPAGETVRFYYQSNLIFKDSNGNLKPAIDADSDSFVLDERVLRLAIIWRWKAMKQMDYNEDMRNYEMALSQEMGRDGGSRVIRSGTDRFRNATIAWPYSLGPGYI